jgi:hypothetical protein
MHADNLECSSQRGACHADEDAEEVEPDEEIEEQHAPHSYGHFPFTKSDHCAVNDDDIQDDDIFGF